MKNRDLVNRLWYHPWVVAFSNFLLIMCIYSLSRVFFYLITKSAYSDMTVSHFWELMAGGLRFDLTALLYINSLYILLEILPLKFRNNQIYQKIACYTYWIPNIIGVLVNCADMVYVQFTDRRTTITFFTEFQNDDNLLLIFFKSMVQYWYVTLFAIAMCCILILFTRKKVLLQYKKPLWLHYAINTILMCITVYFVVIGIRGGFGAFTRPITLSNALQYTNHPNETNVVLNTPFSLMRSTEGRVFPRYSFFSEKELENIMSPIHQSDFSEVTNKNVVIFILESFSKEYWGYFNHDLENGAYTGYTPFLDSLAAHSVTYSLSLASGRKSIDAMPSVLSSIPMLLSPYILTPYSTNDVSSIAECLSRKGYRTAFFHGAPNGSMGFQAYSRSCGFDSYFGKTEYDNDADYDGYWAIWDEEFLQYYARTMTSFKEPFMTAVFTATSHHPFQVPKRYTDVFPQGTCQIHHCIGYTDNAMRQFFNLAKEQPWYQNTLFVITADHTNMLNYEEYTNDKGRYEVPILFFDPQMSDTILNIVHTEPVSQTDIMPSVLSYLHYDEPYFAFGQDALTKTKDVRYAINYNNPLYQIFSDSILVQYDGGNIKSIYNFKNDRLLHNNLIDYYKDDAVIKDMVCYLQAYIQQYTNRMIDNKLVIEE